MGLQGLWIHLQPRKHFVAMYEHHAFFCLFFVLTSCYVPSFSIIYRSKNALACILKNKVQASVARNVLGLVAATQRRSETESVLRCEFSYDSFLLSRLRQRLLVPHLPVCDFFVHRDGGDAPILIFSFGGVILTIAFGIWAVENL